nr:immunoglobulin light chain junction region [Macaca mulatta]MOX17518.1 immunoglobulin light chain junction region [Macaca mulatta]MOX17633.1 immunoglobulin light chain junction region [Macaca mulatta]MOX17858.1 immunoglobulin light chain junction region [Macaca mulatta]MOX18307.1 immunoglobulin light chain junction region [Macaca mulatta]
EYYCWLRYSGAYIF